MVGNINLPHPQIANRLDDVIAHEWSIGVLHHGVVRLACRILRLHLLRGEVVRVGGPRKVVHYDGWARIVVVC